MEFKLCLFFQGSKQIFGFGSCVWPQQCCYLIRMDLMTKNSAVFSACYGIISSACLLMKITHLATSCFSAYIAKLASKMSGRWARAAGGAGRVRARPYNRFLETIAPPYIGISSDVSSLRFQTICNYQLWSNWFGEMTLILKATHTTISFNWFKRNPTVPKCYSYLKNINIHSPVQRYAPPTHSERPGRKLKLRPGDEALDKESRENIRWVYQDRNKWQ